MYCVRFVLEAPLTTDVTDIYFRCWPHTVLGWLGSPGPQELRNLIVILCQGNCIRYVRRVELLSDHLPIKNIGQNNVAKLVHHFYGNPISPDFLL